MSNNSAATLLTLPPKLRLRIYAAYIDILKTHYVDLLHHDDAPTLSHCLVQRLIAQEFTPFYLELSLRILPSLETAI